jgi:ABC-type transport system substrate-binding protein
MHDRRNHRHRTVWIAAIGVTLLGLASAQSSVRVFTASQPAASFLAHSANTGDAQAIFEAMHCRLLDLTSDFDLAHDLAMAYELGDDGATYTFSLNPDARWHDGTPVTAADVEFSWVAYAAGASLSRVRPAVVTAVAGGTDVVAGAATAAGYADTPGYSGIEVVDDHTVRFTLTGPNALWLVQASDYPNGWLLPKHILADVPWNQWESHPVALASPVGCGPFEFVQRQDGQYVELAAFDAYHLGRPDIDRLFFMSWLTTEVAAAQLESGELDLVLGLSLENAERLDARPGIEILSVPGSAAYQLSIQTERVTDPRVRTAMAYAIDREGINEALFRGLGRVAECCLLNDWAVPEGQEVRPFDPDRARELLAEADWDANRTLTVIYPVGFRGTDTLLPIVQQQLADVGIRLELTPLEGSAFPARLNEAWDWDIFFNQSANMLPDPGSFALWECSDVTQKTAGRGWTYCDPTFGGLWAQGRAETERDARADVYQQIQTIFYDAAPAVNIVVPPTVLGVRERLEGVTATPYLWNAFFDVHNWTAD